MKGEVRDRISLNRKYTLKEYIWKNTVISSFPRRSVVSLDIYCVEILTFIPNSIVFLRMLVNINLLAFIEIFRCSMQKDIDIFPTFQIYDLFYKVIHNIFFNIYVHLLSFIALYNLHLQRWIQWGRFWNQQFIYSLKINWFIELMSMTTTWY